MSTGKNVNLNIMLKYGGSRKYLSTCDRKFL